MQLAVQEAEKAYLENEVPVGAVIVRDGLVVSAGRNAKEAMKDACAHAELLAIQEASKSLGDWRLMNCDLYTTLEPCPMCAGAIIQSRLRCVFYGALDYKWGASETKVSLFNEGVFNHDVKAFYVPADRCSELLKTFFLAKRS